MACPGANNSDGLLHSNLEVVHMLSGVTSSGFE